MYGVSFFVIEFFIIFRLYGFENMKIESFFYLDLLNWLDVLFFKIKFMIEIFCY